MDEREQSSMEIRAHLMARLDAWKSELPAEGLFMGTLGAGVTQRATSLVGTLLARAVTELLPEARLRAKPTWGTYIEAIEKHGPGHTLTCLGRERALVTGEEVQLLRRLRDERNRFAHPEEAEVFDPSGIGSLDSTAVRLVLDDCATVATLPVFDELVCREARRAT